jgi:hypothetical protein
MLSCVFDCAQQTAETVSEQNGWRIEGSEHIGTRVRRILEVDGTHVAANGQIRCWLPADAAAGQEELWCVLALYTFVYTTSDVCCLFRVNIECMSDRLSGRSFGDSGVYVRLELFTSTCTGSKGSCALL